MPEFCIEKSKWLWEKGYNDEAISLLEREMQVHFSDVVQLKTDTSEQAKAKRRVYAQVPNCYVHWRLVIVCHRWREMRRRIRKPTICICENKGADQLCSNCMSGLVQSPNCWISYHGEAQMSQIGDVIMQLAFET